MVLETLDVRGDGPVLFADIAAPPMNLLGPRARPRPGDPPAGRGQFPHHADPDAAR